MLSCGLLSCDFQILHDPDGIYAAGFRDKGDPPMSVIRTIPGTAEERRKHSYDLRVKAAAFYNALPQPDHLTNGDDQRYAGQGFFASFTKGLPHHGPLGEVDKQGYCDLLHALETGDPAAFASLPQGIADALKRRPFTDPQAGLAYDMEGIDSRLLSIPPAYRFSDAGSIGEIAENYWQALCRDVPFSAYGTGAGADDAGGGVSLTGLAAADLSQYAVFDGPKAGGAVTTDTLFRGFTPGDVVGPYLSQFLLLDVPYGATRFEQKTAFGLPGFETVPGKDYMTAPHDWLEVQRGVKPSVTPTFTVGALKFLYRGRDMAQYVHIDELFQAYLNACLVLISPNERGGLAAPLSSGNPYPGSNQEGFGTLGEPNFKVMVAEVATRALKAIWFQKWFVHRRARPETYAGRIHHHMVGTPGADKYPFHPGEYAKLQGTVLPRIKAHNAAVNAAAVPPFTGDSYLLPMAFPEGSPIHPAYGAGHATVAGACVTVLKALFDTDTPIESLIKKAKKAGGGTWVVSQPSLDGADLVPYPGVAAAMTVGSELDKLAANIGIARDFAGVHWRSDYSASLHLGEQVALHFLRETAMTYNEDVFFTFTRFNGTRVTVTETQVIEM